MKCKFTIYLYLLISISQLIYAIDNVPSYQVLRDLYEPWNEFSYQHIENGIIKELHYFYEFESEPNDYHFPIIRSYYIDENGFLKKYISDHNSISTEINFYYDSNRVIREKEFSYRNTKKIGERPAINFLYDIDDERKSTILRMEVDNKVLAKELRIFDDNDLYFHWVQEGDNSSNRKTIYTFSDEGLILELKTIKKFVTVDLPDNISIDNFFYSSGQLIKKKHYLNEKLLFVYEFVFDDTGKKIGYDVISYYGNTIRKNRFVEFDGIGNWTKMISKLYNIDTNSLLTTETASREIVYR